MLTVYNTLTRQKERFIPIRAKQVHMYVCGMTVYDYCHLGHGRMMVVFDMIVRWLQAIGFSVVYVRNITDIDDKIIQRAAAKGQSIDELTTYFTAALHEDCTALGLLPPNYEPRATAYVPQMITMIQRLIEKGHAYRADNGDVYYAVHTFASYGQLSGKSLDDLRAGERVEINPHKRDPLDFVLWKAAKPDEPSWKSPWGLGRPGWHIECSTMSGHLLGEHFDIHGGGADLQFPHHENEIAQSEGAHQHRFVNYWLHNGFIRVDDAKMSKSLGNFFTLRAVLQKFDAEVVRFFILRAHYRSPLNYADSHLEDAHHSLTRLYTALKHTSPVFPAQTIDWQNPFAQRFSTAMNEDFNTAEAVAVLFDLASQIYRDSSPQDAGLLKALAAILGFLQRDPLAFLQATQHAELSSADIEALIKERNTARAAKNWTESDRIRAELLAHNVVLEDGPEGTSWRVR